jgi:hypothetical protein
MLCSKSLRASPFMTYADRGVTAHLEVRELDTRDLLEQCRLFCKTDEVFAVVETSRGIWREE